MSDDKVSRNRNVFGWFVGEQADIEAESDVPVPSIGFGWTTDPSDGAFGVYNGVSWVWGTGGGGSVDWGDIGGTLSDQTDLWSVLTALIPLSYLDTDGTLAANS